MQKMKDFFNTQIDNNLLKTQYYKSYNEDETFRIIVDNLNISDEKKCQYTSLLNDASNEKKNCYQCKCLEQCKNSLQGYCYTPKVIGDIISFSYEACKYQNQKMQDESHQKNISYYHTSKSLLKARMKDIYVDDCSRIEVIKFLDNYYQNKNNKNQKGLYLYGNFGSGKTYMVSALFQELAKDGIQSAIIYFPEFIRNLKASFNNYEEKDSFYNQFNIIKNMPLLLIDDIGAENVSSWSRDEILGPLLQHRMEEELPTFFTSNLSQKELEERYAIGQGKVEKVNAKRIMERIYFLSTEMRLVGANRRKETE